MKSVDKLERSVFVWNNAVVFYTLLSCRPIVKCHIQLAVMNGKCHHQIQYCYKTTGPPHGFALLVVLPSEYECKRLNGLVIFHFNSPMAMIIAEMGRRFFFFLIGGIFNVKLENFFHVKKFKLSLIFQKFSLVGKISTGEGKPL